MFFFYEPQRARVWTSSYPLQPKRSSKFSPEQGRESERRGAGEVGNPLLSRTVQIRTLESTNGEQDRNTLAACSPSSATICDPGVTCLAVTPPESRRSACGDQLVMSAELFTYGGGAGAGGGRGLQQREKGTRHLAIFIKEIKMTSGSVDRSSTLH